MAMIGELIRSLVKGEGISCFLGGLGLYPIIGALIIARLLLLDSFN